MAAKKNDPKDMDVFELDEKLDKGELEIAERKAPDIAETATLQNLEKFLLGEITWAQLNGMTMDEAYGLAEYGYKLYQEGRYHDARTLFEALVLANPYDAYFHNMLGATYQQLDLKEEAIEEYSIAINLDKEHLHAYVNRGELMLQSGDFARALDDLNVAIGLDPDGKDQFTLRAKALAHATAVVLQSLMSEGKGSGKGALKPTPMEKGASKKGAPQAMGKAASSAKRAPAAMKKEPSKRAPQPMSKSGSSSKRGPQPMGKGGSAAKRPKR